ncbi:MAG: hypothetical protein Q8R33_25130 [Burkholderiales bacterium]|nr:hypothetical protein [Burkholderiales bacterium]
MTVPAMSSTPIDADLERALSASRVMVDAPEQTILRALSLWQERPAPTVAGRSILRRLAAALTFDSALTATTAQGIRAFNPGARQMLFSAEGRDIDLRIAAQPAGSAAKFSVSGQIFGPDVTGQAELRAPNYQAIRAWNDMSEFCFEDVPPGACVLMLSSAEWQIELPAFEVTVGA